MMDKNFLCKICILLILSFLIYNCFFTRNKNIIEGQGNTIISDLVYKLEGGSLNDDLIQNWFFDISFRFFTNVLVYNI